MFWMHKWVVVFLMGISISAESFSQEDVSPVKWIDHPISIDGQVKDWDHPFNLFDNPSGLLFSMGNDAEHIYLCFTANEQLKAEKLMKAGWSIRLSCAEKKRKFDATISFPATAVTMANLKSEFRNVVGIYKMNVAAVTAKGFLLHNGEVPLVNNDGLTIAIGVDSTSKIVYEIAIPIKELAGGGNLQLNELVTLDIMVNALGKQEATQTAIARNAIRTGASGGGRMGMGGNRRAGMLPAERDRAVAEKYSLMDKVDFKQKFRLSSH